MSMPLYPTFEKRIHDAVDQLADAILLMRRKPRPYVESGARAALRHGRDELEQSRVYAVQNRCCLRSGWDPAFAGTTIGALFGQTKFVF
jgi:hypothetical protein